MDVGLDVAGLPTVSASITVSNKNGKVALTGKGKVTIGPNTFKSSLTIVNGKVTGFTASLKGEIPMDLFKLVEDLLSDACVYKYEDCSGGWWAKEPITGEEFKVNAKLFCSPLLHQDQKCANRCKEHHVCPFEMLHLPSGSIGYDLELVINGTEQYFAASTTIDGETYGPLTVSLDGTFDLPAPFNVTVDFW